MASAKKPNYSANETKMMPPTDAERKKYGMAPAPRNPPTPKPRPKPIKVLAKGGGIEIRGKTRGKMC